jgi:hypothetical protein
MSPRDSSGSTLGFAASISSSLLSDVGPMMLFVSFLELPLHDLAAFVGDP